MSTRRWPIRPAAGGERGPNRTSQSLRRATPWIGRACSRALLGWPPSLAEKNGRGGRSRPSPAVRSPSLAKQVLRNARRGEAEVARLLQFAAQPAQVYVEQLSFPFAHLAGDDHGLDIAALNHLHDSTRYVVDREHVDVRAVEDDDVGLLAGRERAGLAVQSKVFRTVDGGVAQHVPHIEERQRTRRRRRELVGRRVTS